MLIKWHGLFLLSACIFYLTLEHSVVLVILTRPNFMCIINNRSMNHRELMTCKLCQERSQKGYPAQPRQLNWGKISMLILRCIIVLYNFFFLWDVHVQEQINVPVCDSPAVRIILRKTVPEVQGSQGIPVHKCDIKQGSNFYQVEITKIVSRYSIHCSTQAAFLTENILFWRKMK